MAAYLVLRLVPTLEQALRSLKNVSWEWVVGAVLLEVLSETGFVVSWRAIVDPDRVLERDGRGSRMDQRVAWAQLGGGLLVPGGSLGGMGVGGWILRPGLPAYRAVDGRDIQRSGDERQAAHRPPASSTRPTSSDDCSAAPSRDHHRGRRGDRRRSRGRVPS